MRKERIVEGGEKRVEGGEKRVERKEERVERKEGRVGIHYRETIVWKKAMEAARDLYRLAPRLPREETYGMRSQITRAVVSVPANIAEGWTRESVREKAQFLSIAQGSLAETETLLTLCEQVGWFLTQETRKIRQLLDEVSRILTTLRRNLRDR